MLSHVVEEALDATSTAAQARGIGVTVDVRADATVLGNEDLLVMAVRNLIDNAVQYSDPGKRIIVSTDLEGEVASISVVDQGIGIAPAEVERIFERFYRVDPARSRETGGTGPGPEHRETHRAASRRRRGRVEHARGGVHLHA